MTQPISAQKTFQLLQQEATITKRWALAWKIAYQVSLVAFAALSALILTFTTLSFGATIGLPFATAGVLLAIPMLLDRTSIKYYHTSQQYYENGERLQSVIQELEPILHWTENDIEAFTSSEGIECRLSRDEALPCIAHFKYWEKVMNDNNQKARENLQRETDNLEAEKFYLNTGWDYVETKVLPATFRAAFFLQAIHRAADQALWNTVQFHPTNYTSRRSQREFFNKDLYFSCELPEPRRLQFAEVYGLNPSQLRFKIFDEVRV